jgi:bifunctional DNA-binding transcriptional regulator/antitoxin component of YhaV-PrlF toxin-antitoxin module
MSEDNMLSARVTLGHGGRVLIPVEIRKALGMEIGDEFLMKVENQELKMFSLHHAVQEAQSLMAKYNPKKISLSDEIIKDRRDEA